MKPGNSKLPPKTFLIKVSIPDTPVSASLKIPNLSGATIPKLLNVLSLLASAKASNCFCF